MPYIEPPPCPPSRDPRPTVPQSHVLRPFLERLRQSAIAEANELSRLLGLPTVRQDRDKRGGGE